GYMAGDSNEVYLTDEDGSPAYAVIRGTQVQYMVCDDGRLLVDVAGTTGYCLASAVKDNLESVVPAQVQYVRTAVNLRTEDNHILDYLTNKGDTVAISGCDYIRDDGSVHMYKVEVDGNEGYIMPWYLAGTYEEAMSNYDQDGNYQIHAGRGDGFGGGSGDNLDYFPREKGDFADQGNVMPDEVRALYLTIDSAEHIDEYLAIAEGTGINTFIFDVQDGGGVAFSAPSVEPYSPSTYRSGYHSAEDYQGYVQKAKDAGYYVVGRITTFTDYNLIYDHPEWSILDETGAAKLINGNYWPSGFNRRVWECKVALAVDAVKLCGFNEIQFDYVRFPDLCAGYEEAGTIDYQSTYGETKAQGIQRFLMYATDVLHEMGVYVGADVFGESAYTYVTAYGQYWPAISNVVDVIGGMPYPDHFGSYGGYRPWEHPYDTVYEWATYAARRQTEIPTPAKVRTWIQCYDAIRSPYNHYGVTEVTDEIRGLRDGGCMDGYMTWNGSSSRNKYTELREAFNY
ncbi:MAG: putative glycoside hydrolase, partial [Oscillospiraceae bacterium]|nr:putative glycoside hydrolase [Oscillospiraceae bacterium]